MKKKCVQRLFILGIALSVVSCAVRRPYPPVAPSGRAAAKSHSSYGKETRSRLSKQFGVRLTKADNIKLYDVCSQWLGVGYRHGGGGKNGVDCSGFVSAVYKQVYGTRLERSSAGMLKKNCSRIRKSKLREGDLVFFKTTGRRFRKIPTHVGIYLKNGRFIHAKSSRGVGVNTLSEAYYVRTWLVGGRVKR